MKSHYLLAIPILASSLGANAEVTLDGTLGRGGALPGPDYLIGADLGQQRGGNLFHSFKNFNLSRLESATFSGPNSINNIISRVTGGNSSNIDGLIRSTVPADMYFLNPNGIMFGPNAQLDVQGSFHVSTADYLRLGNGGRFDARNPSDSLLTIAPVEAFGFFTDTPAPISLHGSKFFVLPDKRDISIVGGDILMERAEMEAFGGDKLPGGKIKIASVASKGEVILLESDLLVSSFDELGDISMIGKGKPEGSNVLSVSGEQAGLLIIRGKNMLLSNRAFIVASTDDTGPGEGINIKLSGQLKLTKACDIHAKTFGIGQTAPILIEVDRLELRDGSQITSNIWSSGQGNDITIKANEILLSGVSKMAVNSTDGAVSPNTSSIASISHTSRANAIEATINIEADHLVIEKQGSVNVASLGVSDAGSINLNVGQLAVNSGGNITSSTVGLGDGGSINIQANDIVLSDVGAIQSTGIGPSKGKAGDISVEANNLKLTQGGNINVFTLGLGKSGTINLKISDHLHLSGQADKSMFFLYDFLNTQLKGMLPLIGVMPEDMVGPSKISAAVINLGPESAGNIDIAAGRLSLENGAKITGEHRGMGDAGDIGIRASDFRLKQSTITTETFGGGGGGNISLNTSNLLYLREGNITTSVGTGRGKGGDITISEPTFIVLNQGQIKAQADEGQGGNIRIIANQFITSPDSLISASSRLGLDGDVQIDSPAVDMDAMLVVLPGGHLEAQLPKKCRYKSVDDINTFYIYPEHEGKMRNPDDFIE